MDEEWSTRANVGIQYYLTPTISVQGLTHWGYADGKTVTQPAYALNLGSDLTENLEVELGYYWSGTDRMEQNQIRVGVWYQHLNH
jgi:opacity protein-like surface antigen